MWYAVKKFILFLLLPPASLLILIGIGFAIVKRHRRAGKTLIITGCSLLYLLSTSYGSALLMRPLESGYPPQTRTDVRADAIVVLAGGVKDLSWVNRSPEPSSMSLERLVAGIGMYRKSRIPLVIMGGVGSPIKTGIPEADAMADAARRLGVPRADIIVENRSRRTLESAAALKAVVKGETIILVTSAFHMKRSSAMFRKQGVTVIAAPAGYQSERLRFSLFSLIPSAGNLQVSSTAVYEYLALLWYWITGEI